MKARWQGYRQLGQQRRNAKKIKSFWGEVGRIRKNLRELGRTRDKHGKTIEKWKCVENREISLPRTRENRENWGEPGRTRENWGNRGKPWRNRENPGRTGEQGRGGENRGELGRTGGEPGRTGENRGEPGTNMGKPPENRNLWKTIENREISLPRTGENRGEPGQRRGARGLLVYENRGEPGRTGENQRNL
jgi:hypothetical protein